MYTTVCMDIERLQFFLCFSTELLYYDKPSDFFENLRLLNDDSDIEGISDNEETEPEFANIDAI